MAGVRYQAVDLLGLLGLLNRLLDNALNGMDRLNVHNRPRLAFPHNLFGGAGKSRPWTAIAIAAGVV